MLIVECVQCAIVLSRMSVESAEVAQGKRVLDF